MRSRKQKSGLFQALAAFLVLYAAVTLLPAGVYALKDARGEAAESLPAPESTAPEFLEGFSPAESQKPSASLTGEASLPTDGDVFTLYDQSADKTLQVPGRELLPAALACEMDLSAPEEALKAQAVACYTLFSRRRANGEAIACDSEAWQVWTTEALMRERWGEDYESSLAVLQKAVDAVYGQILQYQGEPILAAYSAISAGSTEAAGNVWEREFPYLRAVASPGDALSDGYLSKAAFSAEDLKAAALAAFQEDPPELSGDPADWITGVEYTPSGYVKAALLGGKRVTGAELRTAFSLRSAAFQIEYGDETFTFTVRGWGHGVGMSQAGAAFLAKRGARCQEILAHYYPGTELILPEGTADPSGGRPAEDTE